MGKNSSGNVSRQGSTELTTGVFETAKTPKNLVSQNTIALLSVAPIPQEPNRVSFAVASSNSEGLGSFRNERGRGSVSGQIDGQPPVQSLSMRSINKLQNANANAPPVEKQNMSSTITDQNVNLEDYECHPWTLRFKNDQLEEEYLSTFDKSAELNFLMFIAVSDIICIMSIFTESMLDTIDDTYFRIKSYLRIALVLSTTLLAYAHSRCGFMSDQRLVFYVMNDGSDEALAFISERDQDVTHIVTMASVFSFLSIFVCYRSSRTLFASFIIIASYLALTLPVVESAPVHWDLDVTMSKVAFEAGGLFLIQVVNFQAARHLEKYNRRMFCETRIFKSTVKSIVTKMSNLLKKGGYYGIRTANLNTASGLTVCLRSLVEVVDDFRQVTDEVRNLKDPQNTTLIADLEDAVALTASALIRLSKDRGELFNAKVEVENVDATMKDFIASEFAQGNIIQKETNVDDANISRDSHISATAEETERSQTSRRSEVQRRTFGASMVDMSTNRMSAAAGLMSLQRKSAKVSTISSLDEDCIQSKVSTIRSTQSFGGRKGQRSSTLDDPASLRTSESAAFLQLSRESAASKDDSCDSSPDASPLASKSLKEKQRESKVSKKNLMAPSADNHISRSSGSSLPESNYESSETVPDPLIEHSTGNMMEAFNNKLGHWDFPTILVFAPVPNAPALHITGIELLKPISEKLQLPLVLLDSFLSKLDKCYQKNPYHNSMHAADVAASCSFVAHACGLSSHHEPTADFAFIIAALGHDADHPGKNNSFLVATGDPLAIRYNDESVLEMYHSAKTVSLLEKEDTIDLLTFMTPQQKTVFRKQMVELILETDMQHHFTFIEQFSAKLQEGGFNTEDATDRHFIRRIAIKVADLGHAAKPWEMHEIWSRRVMEEFFAQGRAEAAASIPVTPMMDETKVKVPQSQQGFLQFVCEPIFRALVKVQSSEGLIEQYCITNLEANQAKWKQLGEEEAAKEAAKTENFLPGSAESDPKVHKSSSVKRMSSSSAPSGDK